MTDKSEKDIKSNEQSSKEAEILFQACQQYSQQFATSMIYEVLKAKDSYIQEQETRISDLIRNQNEERGMFGDRIRALEEEIKILKEIKAGLERSLESFLEDSST